MLTFLPGSDAPAGAVPFEVEVTSKDAVALTGKAPGLLQVIAPEPVLSGHLQPAVAKGHVDADLVLFLQNPTRAPLTASLSARDPAGVLAFDIEPETVIVPPGTGGSVSLHLQAHKRSFIRGRKLPFEVLVAPEGGATTKVGGTFVQERSTLRLLGRLGLAFLAFVGLLVVALIVFFYVKYH